MTKEEYSPEAQAVSDAANKAYVNELCLAHNDREHSND
jgi:hypothetical protein